MPESRWGTPHHDYGKSLNRPDQEEAAPVEWRQPPMLYAFQDQHGNPIDPVAMLADMEKAIAELIVENSRLAIELTNVRRAANEFMRWRGVYWAGLGGALCGCIIACATVWVRSHG
jgi:hypothetical protein